MQDKSKIKDTISDEFSLIKKITANIPQINKNVIIGVGDDCAVIKESEDKYLLATCDAYAAGVHFLPQYTEPETIGQKAISVNVSDIAAMGGTPSYCLVSLIIPKSLPQTYVEKLYQGINNACLQYKIQIIGGNISQGDTLIINIFMLGHVAPEQLILRSGAKPGDKVLVTGNLGSGLGGLIALKNTKLRLPKNVRAGLIKKYTTPLPRLEEAKVLSKLQTTTSMIDISDGLTSDILHICSQSNVSVQIFADSLPVSEEIKLLAKQMKKNPYDVALASGDEYELLFTAASQNAEEIIQKIREKTGTDVTVIGEIVGKDKGNWIIYKDGIKKTLKPLGWNHFGNEV